MNDRGDVAAVWVQGWSSWSVRTRRFDAAVGRWQGARQISSTLHDEDVYVPVVEPQAVVGANGDVLAAAYWGDDLQMRRFDAAARRWDPVQRRRAEDAFHPRLAGDVRGNAIVVALGGDGVEASSFDVDARTWVPKVVEDDRGRYVIQPVAASAANGRAIVVWLRRGGPVGSPDEVRARLVQLGG